MRFTKVILGLLMVTLIVAIADPTAAVTLSFSQTTGFRSSSGATLQTGTGGAPVPGRGGLEFFGAVTAPPGPPIGDGSVPPSTWNVVGWGCSGVAPFGSCSPDGIIAPSGSNPFTNANRSALRVTGFSGALTDAAWTDITLIEHRNNPISGNVLKTVAIDSILRLGDDPFSFASPDTVLINFRETPNAGPCTITPAAGAPANPLGTSCDDFVTIDALDLGSVDLGGGLFLDFRLDPRDGALVCTGVPANDPAACLGYTGPTIIIYTGEADTNSLAVQARLRLASVPEPASLLLLGGGLFATGAMVRLRRRR
jgi:hypothetical protein